MTSNARGGNSASVRRPSRAPVGEHLRMFLFLMIDGLGQTHLVFEGRRPAPVALR
jgi:hypothetical protein